MVHFEKSQPAPSCLVKEKAKKSGDYKCGGVLERIKTDFKNKCYICETRAPKSINVEHFIPHEGDKDLEFNWDNLFWSCVHCNNTKLNTYKNLLDCTKPSDNVETSFNYIFDPFPGETVQIEATNSSAKTIETKNLLNAVYNGTTKLKKLESANIRSNLLDEIMDFQQDLRNYFNDLNDAEDIIVYRRKIKHHLSIGSNYTAFKRWRVRNNKVLMAEFARFIT